MIPALITLWLCVWFFQPRRPWRADEERWLYYAHDKGRHSWGVVIAAVISIALLGGILFNHTTTALNDDLAKMRGGGMMSEYFWELDKNNQWVLRRT